MKQRGVFITFEGIDGTGKSTHFRLLVRHLRACGYRVCATREPGGTLTGEQIRRILLASDTVRLVPLAELALIYAARAQHLEEIVRPALERGDVVVSDRYNDASFAYQGYGRKLGSKVVREFDRIVCGETQPDLTLVLDLLPRAALARAQKRERRRDSHYARFEAQGLRFHERVRAGYLAIARKNPKRVRVISTDRPVEGVQQEIRQLVNAFLQRQAKVPRPRG